LGRFAGSNFLIRLVNLGGSANQALTLRSIGNGFIESNVGSFGIDTWGIDGSVKLGKLGMLGKFGKLGMLGKLGIDGSVKLGMGGINWDTLSVRSFVVGNPNFGIDIDGRPGKVFNEFNEYFAQSISGFSNFKPETRLSGSLFKTFVDVLLIKLLTLFEIPLSGFWIFIDGGCGNDIIYL